MKKTQNSLLFHLALWLPVALATPLIVFIQNPDDFTGHLLAQVFLLIAFTGGLTLISWLVVKILPSPINKLLISLMLAIATALVIQGYIVHGLIDFGQLDGSLINWKGLGPIYRIEYKVILLALIILTILYFFVPKILKTLSSLLIIFSLAQLLLVVPSYFQRETPVIAADDFDDSVYEFSSEKNIIHILADGFQADIVKQVFDENPELANEFTGFDFFENHLGRFQATAPTIPSILTGKFFDLNKGFNSHKLRENIKNHSYTNELHKAGYRLDFAPISNIYCHEQANSCVPLTFRDLKSRGYSDDYSIIGSLMLLLDISLFRHTPLYIKSRVYNNGAWLLSSKLSKGTALFPDPIIREWIENMTVTTTQPIYKWYHFIGTHVPAQWDANCNFQGRQPQSREYYKAQTHCVLNGMANLIIKLKQENIYDNTTIIVNGDHGCNIPAYDLIGLSKNRSTYTDSLLGVSRPLFMFKKANNNEALYYNNSPTTLEDVAPTILDAVNLSIDKYAGVSAFKKLNDGENKRIFHRYISKTFWTGNPVAYNEYHISGDIKDRSNWQLVTLNNRDKAPTAYERMSYPSAFVFSKGLSLSIPNSETQMEAAVNGAELFILLSDLETKASTINIKLKPHKSTKHLVLSLFINNENVAKNIEIKPDYQNWLTLEIPINEGILTAENNLFKFEFKDTGSDANHLATSAIVRSLYLN